MANRFRGESDLEINGRTYTLSIGLAEMAAMERALEVDGVLAVLRAIHVGSAAKVLPTLKIALTKRQPEIARYTEAQFGDVIDAVGLVAVSNALDEACANFLDPDRKLRAAEPAPQGVPAAEIEPPKP